VEGPIRSFYGSCSAPDQVHAPESPRESDRPCIPLSNAPAAAFGLRTLASLVAFDMERREGLQ
jgi:hypothetical protein